jgi:hypothetical protein
MRPKPSLDRLLTLKPSAVYDLMGSFTAHRSKYAVMRKMGARTLGARKVERYEGRAGASRHGGKQGVIFRGEPHAASGSDHHAEAGARARQARRCGLMLQSLPDDHILQSFFRCWHFSDMPRQPDDVRSPGKGRHPAAKPRLPFLTLDIPDPVTVISIRKIC